MTTDLRRRLTDAIRNAPGMGLTVTSVVDAVMAVLDEEIAALRAERDLTLATTRGDNWEAAYHHERLARAQQAELALARVRDDCQEQTHRPITDLLDQGIRSQALRTLNIIKRALNEDTTDQAPDTPPPVAVPADAGLLEHQQGE